MSPISTIFTSGISGDPVMEDVDIATELVLGATRKRVIKEMV